MSKNDLQYYADYIELVCLITNDYLSQADIKDRLADEGEVFEEEEVEDGKNGTLDAQNNDKAETFVNSCFSFIKSRLDQYKESYPFIYDEIQGIKLIKKKELTNRQKLYISLLVSSSINSFKKTD